MMLRISAAALCLSLLACGEEVDPELLKTELTQKGNYGVGFRSFKVNYRPPLATEDRELLSYVWYPSEVTSGEKANYVLRNSDQAIVEAAPAPLSKLPVVIFSHGHQAYAAVMSQLMEHLASHGYIAVAPTHTGNTVTNGDNRKTEIYYQRPLDIKATLDQLKMLNPELSELIGEQVILVGHSFGGYTGFALAGAEYQVETLSASCGGAEPRRGYCETIDADKEMLFKTGFEDSRILGLVSVDSGDFDLFGKEGFSKLSIPVLHMVAEQSGHAPGQTLSDSYWQALKHPGDVRILMKGAAHNDFVDSCGAGLNIRCSMLPAPLVIGPTNAYILAFIEDLLQEKKRYAPMLQGEVSLSTYAEISGH